MLKKILLVFLMSLPLLSCDIKKEDQFLLDETSSIIDLNVDILLNLFTEKIEIKSSKSHLNNDSIALIIWEKELGKLYSHYSSTLQLKLIVDEITKDIIAKSNTSSITNEYYKSEVISYLNIVKIEESDELNASQKLLKSINVLNSKNDKVKLEYFESIKLLILSFSYQQLLIKEGVSYTKNYVQ